MYKVVGVLVAAAGLGLLLAVSAVTLGLAARDHLIYHNLGNGLEGVVGEAYYSGRAALRNAQRECGGSQDDGTLDLWFRRHRSRVVELQLLDGLCPLGGLDAVQAYRAKVQSYTLFMIPTDTAFVQCSPDGGTPLKVDCTGAH